MFMRQSNNSDGEASRKKILTLFPYYMRLSIEGTLIIQNSVDTLYIVVIVSSRHRFKLECLVLTEFKIYYHVARQNRTLAYCNCMTSPGTCHERNFAKRIDVILPKKSEVGASKYTDMSECTNNICQHELIVIKKHTIAKG